MIDLGMIANAVSLASKAYDLAKKANIIELQETMMSLREAVVNARDETLELRGRVRELEAELQSSAAMNFERPVYWRTAGDRQDGPFCQACWDKEHKAVRLQSAHDDSYWRCKVCGNNFNKCQ